MRLFIIVATDSTSQTNTVEMYGTHDGSFFNDDAKSFSTYAKDEEDLSKNYEENYLNQTKFAAEQGTYVSPQVASSNESPPWAKTEGESSNSISLD